MTWRHNLRTTAAAAILAASLGSMAACIESGRLYVRIGPPSPIVETRLAAPGAGYVWIDGYQRWDGRGYVWVQGRWERPPRPRAVWVTGRWQQDRRGWYYIDGHWR